MNVFGVSLLAMAVMSLLPGADIPLRPLAAIILGSFLALGVITVWQVVGFYRSLREHMRSGESAAGTVWGRDSRARHWHDEDGGGESMASVRGGDADFAGRS